jgi:NDP-sugar pyrophosphorylase family protein
LLAIVKIASSGKIEWDDCSHMKAMILAAGFGTRLFPLTIDRTKPAIPFLGKPLVGYVAEYIAGFGIKEVVVNLHHQPDSVIAALGDGSSYNVHIDYAIEEPNILGTAGALDNARPFLQDDTFIVVNGKIITDIDLAEAIETHKRSGAMATMVLKANNKREKFTIVELSDGYVTTFGGYPSEQSGNSQPPLMFTGIHILEPEVFEYIPRGVYSDIVPVFYGPALKEGRKIAAHITDENWFELSTISRYLDISLAMMDGPDVFFGSGCNVCDSASIHDSVLWDNVIVGENVSLRRTIVSDGVTIRGSEHIENAAIVLADSVRSCNEIPEKALKGYFHGDNYIVPLN